MPFIKGQSGNPLGRPKGVGDRRTAIRKILEPHQDLVIAQVIEKATSGDNEMIKLFFSYCFAKPKSEAVDLEIGLTGVSSKDDIRQIVSEVLLGAIKGDVPDDQGKSIAALVKTFVDIDNDKRMEEIEKRLGITKG